MKLSKNQQEAVAHRGGPALVLAVPGSGKTTVLLHRVGRLLEQGVKKEQILAVTFSRTQAEDMRRRSQQMQTAGVAFQTIHRFCFAVLKEELARKKRAMRVIESEPFHKTALLRKTAWELFGRGLESTQVDGFFRAYGKLVNTMQAPETVLGEAECALVRAYEDEKRRGHCLDFEDMLRETHRLLEEDDALLRRVRRAYRHVLLDEGQDTSRLQWEILRKVAEPEHNLFVVADDDQSVYGFRGAEPALLQHFAESNPRPTVYRLEDNHRSLRAILEPAERLIRHNTSRFPKTLHAARGAGGTVQVRAMKDLYAQTRWVARELEERPAGRTAAVLYRKRIAGLPIASALRKAGIAFDWHSPPEDFLRHPILEDIRDFYLAARSPSDVDVWARVLRKTNAFVPAETLSRWKRTPGLCVWDALRQDPTASAREIARRKNLIEHIKALTKRPFRDGVRRILEETGYGAWLREWARRQDGLNVEVVTDALRVSAAFVDDAEAWIDVVSSREEAQGASLVLSTIHGAKGLEFDEVFMVDLIQHEFPGERDGDVAEPSEEERRLFYVGMTRAKEKLTLLSLQHRAGLPCEPSQFIQESGLCGRR